MLNFFTTMYFACFIIVGHFAELELNFYRKQNVHIYILYHLNIKDFLHEIKHLMIQTQRFNFFYSKASILS